MKGNEMQYFCKAVGKYKEKFRTTGLLLLVDGVERWVDIPGQLNWKQYKENNVGVTNMTQNDKGYWSGELEGASTGQGQPPQNSSSYTPPSQERPPQRDVQDEIRFAQALNLACQDHCHDKIDECGKEARVKEYYEILKTREFPAYMSSTSKIF